MEDVVLVVPPFRQTSMPALGVSQLKSVVLEAGFTCRVVYANILLAHTFGILYEMIAEDPPTAEFLFSRYLFDESQAQTEEICARLFHADALAGPPRRYEELLTSFRYIFERFFPGVPFVSSITALMNRAEQAIQSIVDRILKDRPMIVGVSSMSSDLCASLAIIKEVKKLRPEVHTIIGGPNCLGEMGAELLKTFPYIDFVAQGEAEKSFIELIMNLKTGKPHPPPEGILDRAKLEMSGPACCTASEVTDLDALPFPDFGDYFEQVPSGRLLARGVVRLPFETIRGCPWKVTQGCTFCSFHHSSTLRRKTASRVLAELESALAHYPASTLHCFDLIFEEERYRTILPTLARTKSVKALVLESTGGVPRGRIAQLAESHVSFFQPGIESLSPTALRLMNKPTTTPKNLQTLKWCGEMNIVCGWNYLCVIPGETPQDVEDTAVFIRNIHHLQPPVRGPHQIAVQRFSAYFQFPDRYDLGTFEVPMWMQNIFALPLQSLRHLAYTFHSPQLDQQALHPAYSVLTWAIREWHQVWNRSYLIAVPTWGCLLVLDTRPVRRRWQHCLRGAEREILEFCDQARSLADVESLIESRHLAGNATAILNNLVASRLVVHIDDRYLSVTLKYRPGCKFIRARFISIDFCNRDLDNVGRLLGSGALRIAHWKMRLFLLKLSDVTIPRIKSLTVATLLLVATRLAFMFAAGNTITATSASDTQDS